ncbi:3-methyl-2-oxobutanoate hydroxymethyltransferase [Dinoroseobacter sp. S76]|uniref:3-methyl-2-oxobutanoate hydroxymethyltransferase n=1 Tax=Dinoroseobacter sp. S76 TaxID=3415124 RepID=UPI003C7B743F
MAKQTLLELKNRGSAPQLTMVHVSSAEQAEAAEAAGIDMLCGPFLPQTRTFPAAAPNTMYRFGLKYGQYVSADQCLRAAFDALECGADIIYTAQSLEFVEAMAKQGIAVCGHLGLVPPKASWTGGLRAVGKTAEQALTLFQQIKDLENAGAFAVELEVVPDRVADEIARRSSLVTISMGAGTGCDIQYLFSSDILGEAGPRVPRHAKVYRDFKAEYDRLQQERIAAYQEFAQDVQSGAFPGPGNLVRISDEEYAKLMAHLA